MQTIVLISIAVLTCILAIMSVYTFAYNSCASSWQAQTEKINAEQYRSFHGLSTTDPL